MERSRSRSALGYAGSIPTRWQRALDICGVLVGLECGCVCCSAQQRVCDISSSADMGMVMGGGIPDENAVRLSNETGAWGGQIPVQSRSWTPSRPFPFHVQKHVQGGRGRTDVTQLVRKPGFHQTVPRLRDRPASSLGSPQEKGTKP